MNLKITEAASKEIKKVIEEQNLEDVNVRVQVSGGGCSGYQYNLGFEDADKLNEESDDVFEQYGLKVIADKKSMLYLDGTEVDFMQDLSKRGFVFNNPLATKGCGCGSSFSV